MHPLVEYVKKTKGPWKVIFVGPSHDGGIYGHFEFMCDRYEMDEESLYLFGPNAKAAVGLANLGNWREEYGGISADYFGAVTPEKHFWLVHIGPGGNA